MAGTSDVIAGNAWVRVGVKDETGPGLAKIGRNVEDKRPETPMILGKRTASRYAEARAAQVAWDARNGGGSVPQSGTISGNIAKGAESAGGAILAQKAVATLAPTLLTTGAAANMATGSLAGTGAAMTATGVAAGAATAPTIGLGTAVAAVALPLLAIAAAAGAVYVVFFKWGSLPAWAKLLLVAVFPIIIPLRLLAAAVNLCILPFKLLGLAVSGVLLPFRLTFGAIGLLTSGLMAIPGALMKLPGLLVGAISKIPSMLSSVASGAWSLAKSTASAIGSMVSSVASMPGRALSAIGGFLSAGASMAESLSGRIIGPLKTAAGAFSDYGVKLDQIAEKYELNTYMAAVFALASERTGMSIETLTNRMPEGSAAFEAYAAEAERLGLIMAGGRQDALDYAASQTRLKDAQKGFSQTLGAAVAPILRETTELMVGAISGATKWVSEHKPLIATAFKVASAIATAGTVLGALGSALGTAGAFVSPLVVGFGAVAAGLATVEYYTGTGRGLWAAYSDSIMRVWGVASQYLGQMWGFASRVFGGITDAVRAGNLELAITILWAGAKVAWINGLQEIDSLTKGVFGGILQPLAAGNWTAAGEGMTGALTIAFLTIKQVATDAWEGVKSTGATAWLAVQDGFDGAVTAMEIGLVRLSDKFKGWAIGILQTFKTGVVDPIATALNDSALSRALGLGQVANAASAGIVDAQVALTKSRAKTDPDKEAANLEAGLAGRIDKRRGSAAAAEVQREGVAMMARLAIEEKITKLKERQAELAADSTPEAERLRRENDAALTTALAQAKAEKEKAEFKAPEIEAAGGASGFTAKSAPIGTFASSRIGSILGVTSEDKAAKVVEQQGQAAKLLSDSAKLLADAAKQMGISADRFQFSFGS